MQNFNFSKTKVMKEKKQIKALKHNISDFLFLKITFISEIN